MIKVVIKSFCVIDRVAVILKRKKVIMMKRLRLGDLLMLALKLLIQDTLKGMLPVTVMNLMTKSGLSGLQKTNALRKCQLRLTR